MIKVEDMMTRHPHTLLATDTIRTASMVMRNADIRHLPIIDTADRLLGVISQRDILSAQESSLTHPITQDDLMSTSLSAIMRKNVMSVSPKAGLKESALYMQKNHVGCLPVLDHGKLVGIITDSDFVTIAINLLEIQEDIEIDERNEIDEDF